MPRKARTKRLTEWLDRAQLKFKEGREAHLANSWNNYFIRVPLWARHMLLREGCKNNDWGHLMLPSGKAIATHKHEDRATVFPGQGTDHIDLTRFYPKSQTGAQGGQGQVRHPSQRTQSVLFDGLSSAGLGGTTSGQVPNAPPILANADELFFYSPRVRNVVVRPSRRARRET